MPLPKRIRVGSRTYEVRLSADPEHAGRTDSDRLIVSINDSIPQGGQQETLLHEILHAITNYTGIYNDLGHKKEEKVVNRIAPVLLDVVRRNLAVVEYLRS